MADFHETIRPKITIPGKEARLVMLQDREIANISRLRNCCIIITVYEGIKEKVLLF